MHILRSIIVVAIISVQSTSSEQCKNFGDRFEHHLGPKTAYRFLANDDVNRIEFEGCQPQKIWMLVRHGTRNPSLSFMEKMRERLPEIRDIILENNSEPSERLRNSDLYAFKKWTNKLEEPDNKKLTREGEDEMIELAERMQARFPTLFPPTYSNSTYYFKYTSTQRTKASAKYFAAGLFGRPAVKGVWYPKPEKDDPVLRFYNLCRNWKVNVKGNPSAFEEKKLFEKSAEMLGAIELINDDLNLEEEITIEDAYLMYMTCAFETAWNKRRKSPWCSVFSPETLQVMEFAEDLQYYYKSGYGYEVTYKQACPLFKDMIEFLDDKSKSPRSVVYFSHSGALLKFLAHLGLYKDNQLLHTDINSNHLWRTSKLNAFGSNIAFVMYRCGQKSKVAVLHQERSINLPNCGPLCDLSAVKQYYKSSINNCSFNKICNAG